MNGTPLHRIRSIQEALAAGLPLVPRPYADLARQLGVTEGEVLAVTEASLVDKTIRRLGAVVKHRPFGYVANAMCVWDVPGDRVQAVGRLLTGLDFVTLCYQRRRSLPQWPYNLYCMIHGKSRAEVEQRLVSLRAHADLDGVPSKVLFSTREFKQRGSRRSGLDKALVRELQRGIPVTERPFADVAQRLNTTEVGVVEELNVLLSDGRLSRFGPMINVERMGGTFILAAMEVPAERFESVALAVNARPEVAHNYEREHRLNMWFVVATSTVDRAFDVCREIEAETGLRVYAMPKEEEYFLELVLDV